MINQAMAQSCIYPKDYARAENLYIARRGWEKLDTKYDLSTAISSKATSNCNVAGDGKLLALFAKRLTWHTILRRYARRAWLIEITRYARRERLNSAFPKPSEQHPALLRIEGLNISLSSHLPMHIKEFISKTKPCSFRCCTGSSRYSPRFATNTVASTEFPPHR